MFEMKCLKYETLEFTTHTRPTLDEGFQCLRARKMQDLKEKNQKEKKLFSLR